MQKASTRVERPLNLAAEDDFMDTKALSYGRRFGDRQLKPPDWC